MISQPLRIGLVTGCGALIAATMLLWTGTASAAQLVIEGPAGSGGFGAKVITLPNGNIVVTDPSFDAPGPIADVGAVYLYPARWGVDQQFARHHSKRSGRERRRHCAQQWQLRGAQPGLGQRYDRRCGRGDVWLRG
jgi:hypothetical protein